MCGKDGQEVSTQPREDIKTAELGSLVQDRALKENGLMDQNRDKPIHSDFDLPYSPSTIDFVLGNDGVAGDRVLGVFQGMTVTHFNPTCDDHNEMEAVLKDEVLDPNRHSTCLIKLLVTKFLVNESIRLSLDVIFITSIILSATASCIK